MGLSVPHDEDNEISHHRPTQQQTSLEDNVFKDDQTATKAHPSPPPLTHSTSVDQTMDRRKEVCKKTQAVHRKEQSLDGSDPQSNSDVPGRASPSGMVERLPFKKAPQKVT